MINEIQELIQDHCLHNYRCKVTYNHKQVSSLVRESQSNHMLTLNTQGQLLKVNPTFCDLVGYKEDELIGQSILKYLHEQDRDSFVAHLDSLSRSSYSGVCENQVLTSSGWKWLFWSNKAVRNKKGSIIHISCIARDVTKQKDIEKIFFESEDKYRQIFESVNNAIAIYESVNEGTDFIVREFNQAAEQTTRLSRNEIFGQPVSQVFPGIERFGLMKIFQRVWKTGIPEYQPAKFYQDPRITFWAENYVFKLRSGEIVSIFQDVTEYKQAEEKLKESEEFSRILLEHAPNPIILQNPDTSIQYGNPAFEELTGYSLKEIIGKKAPYPYWPEKKKEEYLEDIQSHFGQGGLLPKIREFQKKSGECFWVEVYVSFVKDTNGKLKQIVSSYIDITERRKGEEKNMQLAALVESSNDAIFGTTLEGIITNWNKGAEKAFGYKGAEIIGKSMSQLVLPDRQNRIAWVKEKILQGEHINNFKGVYLRKDGTIIHLLMTISPVYNAENRIVSVSSVARDITKLKKVQEALKESERFNSSLLENSNNPILVMNPNLSIRYVNKAFETITGFTCAEALHQKPPFPWWKPGWHDQYNAAFQEVIAKGFSKHELLIRRKNGKDLWIEFDTTPIKENGAVKYYLSMWMDKTERKRAEEELLQSEKKYSTLVEKGNDGVIIIQDGLLKFINSKMFAIAGFSKEEALGKPFIDFVSPMCRSFAAERYKRRMAGETALDNIEIEILTKDGQNIPVEISASPIEYEGKLADMAIIRDITRRKLVQNKLKESEEFLSALLDNSPNAISVINPDTSIKYVNSAFEKLTGYSRSQVIGWKAPYPYWIEKDKMKSDLLAGMANRDQRVEKLLRKQDGNLIWVAISSGTIIDEQENLKYFVSNYLDITKSKEAEKAISQSEAKFKNLAEHSPNMIFINTGFKIAYVSQKSEEVMGYSREEFYSPEFDFLTLIAPESRELAIKNFERRKQGDDIGACEYTLIARDGRRIDAIISMSSIQYEQGRGFLGIVTDISERKRTEEEQRHGTQQLLKAMEDMIQAMARIVEMRDPYTAGHQRRVARLCCKIAQEIGLSQDRIDGLRLAALIHDIGKIRVPAEILTHPDGLTEAEFAILKMHPVMGYEIIKDIDLPWPIARIICQHHERMDGSGYPYGISGEEMILEARVLAVADVVEAISSHRPYRPALGADKALAEISQQRGLLFDIKVVDACLKIFQEYGFRFE